MTTITINEQYKLELDNLGNISPHYYEEGGEVITVGMFKGQLTKPKWKHSGKYFTKLSSALQWIVDHSILADYPDELSLSDYIIEHRKRVEDMMSKIDEITKKVVAK